MRMRAPAGQPSPLLHRAHVDPFGGEVALGLDALQVGVRSVGARHQAAQPAQRLVADHPDGVADRPDEPGLGAEELAHLGLLRQARRSAQSVLELDLVEAVVAADEHQHRVAAVGDHGHGLDQRAGGNAHHLRDGVDGPRPRRLHGPRLGQRLGKPLDGLSRGARHLQVGRVPRVGEGDVVLSGGAWRHVLVCADAAHHPNVRLDPVPLQPDRSKMRS